MEKRTRYVLKHIKTGLYWSNKADRTKKLWDAWRFYDEDQAEIWMKSSIYAPDKPDQYELIPVIQSIREENPDEHISKIT